MASKRWMTKIRMDGLGLVLFSFKFTVTLSLIAVTYINLCVYKNITHWACIMSLVHTYFQTDHWLLETNMLFSLSHPQHPLVTCSSLSRVDISWAFLQPQTSFLGCNCPKIYLGESCTHLCIYWRLGCNINLHKRIVLAHLQNWISIWYRIDASLRARSM